MLELMENIVTAKAGLESNDLIGHQQNSAALNTKVEYTAEEMLDALQDATQNFSQLFAERLGSDESNVLNCLLLTDLGRAQMRYYGQARKTNLAKAESKSDSEKWIHELHRSVENTFELANESLMTVEVQDSAYQLAKAHLVNNQLLLLQRRFSRDEVAFDHTFIELIELWSDSIDALCSSIVEPLDPRANSVNFERALCYSNLADLISDGIQRQLQPELFLELELAAREKAIQRLQRIPPSQRSQRCEDNFWINELRAIAERIRYEKQLDPELVVQARELDTFLGGVLDCSLGQFLLYDRLAIASVLPERYDGKRLSDFANSINLEPTRFADSNLEHWLSQFQTD
ncbi:MAG: hypothetical protein R3C03_13045 [Pirellulaceae bacterium]